MQIALENRKEVAANFPRSNFKKKNRVEEGGALGSRVKNKQENTEVKTQKMMRGKVEPFAMPTMVQRYHI